jgi:NTP pyrophosphatase (non-canonical NTP hydrolase)
MITSINEYQRLALSTNTYKSDTLGISARFMGLSGEAGEATDKAKKEIRDHLDTAFRDPQRNLALAHELGDVLWYVATAADALGFTLDQIAELNIQKLADRADRDVIHGSGDNR